MELNWRPGVPLPGPRVAEHFVLARSAEKQRGAAGGVARRGSTTHA